MAARMGHFKLTGSPKRKNYRPRRKLQYSEAPTESPSKSNASRCYSGERLSLGLHPVVVFLLHRIGILDVNNLLRTFPGISPLISY